MPDKTIAERKKEVLEKVAQAEEVLKMHEEVISLLEPFTPLAAGKKEDIDKLRRGAQIIRQAVRRSPE